jgi:Skp family chaperone for outer membrane proteins
MKREYEGKSIQETPLDWQSLGQNLKAFVETTSPAVDADRKTWLTQDAAQRRALSTFWKDVRQQHQRKLRGCKFTSADIQHDLDALSADTDPEHLAAVQAEHREILAKLQKTSKVSQAQSSKARNLSQARLCERMKGVSWSQFKHEPQLMKPVG